ncbi:MAG: ATP-binding protein [Syntrophobacter sp.]
MKSSRLRMRPLAIADTLKSTECYKYAGKAGIEIFEDYQNLLFIDHLDLILELTGDQEILSDIIKRKRPALGVLDRQASMLLFGGARLCLQVDQRESETALETLFASTLLEASPDGVLVIDRDFRIINCNKSPLIPGSANNESIIGKHCFRVMQQSSRPCNNPERCCPVHETQKTGKLARTVYEAPGPDNSRQIRQVTSYPVFNRFGEVAHFVLTIRDMTNDLNERIEEHTQTLKKDLARMAQEDRLSSLGRLVASVCHEINNPITSIVTFTKLILSKIQKRDLAAEQLANMERYLDLSFREAMRCGGIVKNLLTFARPKSVEARFIEIAEVISTIVLLTGHQLQDANVRCLVELPSPPFTAWGDYAQIQQCLLNLIFNAIDAMPGGGTITISGGNDEADDMVWLTVSDTGYGIHPQDLQRIFEPFYSTKVDGKGNGLGLSMVYGIIRQHRGIVEVESEPGQGTTFRIKLPRSPVNNREGEHVHYRDFPARMDGR